MQMPLRSMLVVAGGLVAAAATPALVHAQAGYGGGGYQQGGYGQGGYGGGGYNSGGYNNSGGFGQPQPGLGGGIFGGGQIARAGGGMTGGGAFGGGQMGGGGAFGGGAFGGGQVGGGFGQQGALGGAYGGQQGGQYGQRNFVGRDASEVQAGFRNQFGSPFGGGQNFGQNLQNFNDLREQRRRWRDQQNAPPPVRVQLRPAFDLPVPTAATPEIAAGIQTRVSDVLATRGGTARVSVTPRGLVLTGNVGSDHDRKLMGVLASLEPGVSQVDNQLTVTTTPGPETPLAAPPMELAPPETALVPPETAPAPPSNPR